MYAMPQLLQILDMHFNWMTSSTLTAPSFQTGNQGLPTNFTEAYHGLDGWLYCHAWPCCQNPVLVTYIGNVWSERHLLVAHVQRAESAFHPISVCLSELFPSVIGLDCWTGQIWERMLSSILGLCLLWNSIHTKPPVLHQEHLHRHNDLSTGC